MHSPLFASIHSSFHSFCDALFSAMPVSLSSTLSGLTIPVIAIVGGLSLAAVITVSALYFQHRKRTLWHETARIALEKGQPLPPQPLSDEELDSRPPPGVSFAEWQRARREEARGHDFKGGLVLVAVGAALLVTLGPGARAAGAVPGFIGIALLINTLIQRFSSRANPPSDDRPGQS